MSFKNFLKDKWLMLLTYMILILFTVLLLFTIKTPSYPVIFLCGLYTLALISLLLLEFFKKQRYYKNILHQLDVLDQKYLLSEVIDEADFLEGALLYEILKVTNKSMNDKIDAYQIAGLDYQEYIALWVHEIKTPIASAKLIAENHKDSIVKSMEEEIDKIDVFVEQVLYYSKSNTAEKDYVIKSLTLTPLINKVIKKYAKSFITLPIKLEMDQLDSTVYSDSKWLEFIIGQLISNAIKYLDKPTKVIKIYSEEKDGQICLHIQDNGIGIVSADINRVFDKGFTGENGRLYGKSTGIGLYLCKKLCSKLGLELKLSSHSHRGTTVTLIFPKSKMFLLEH